MLYKTKDMKIINLKLLNGVRIIPFVKTTMKDVFYICDRTGEETLDIFEITEDGGFVYIDDMQCVEVMDLYEFGAIVKKIIADFFWEKCKKQDVMFEHEDVLRYIQKKLRQRK